MHQNGFFSPAMPISVKLNIDLMENTVGASGVNTNLKISPKYERGHTDLLQIPAHVTSILRIRAVTGYQQT